MTAMAVLQDYAVRLAIGLQRKEREEYEVTYRMNDRFQFLEPCFQVVNNSAPIFDYTGWDEQARGDFSCYIDFDRQRAKNFIYQFPDAHATEAFGIMIGGGPLGVITGLDIPRWPIIQKMYPNETFPEDARVAVIEWDKEQSQKFYEYLGNNYKGIVNYIIDEGEDLQHKLEVISEFNIVIGPGSFLTYCAAAMEKAVVEIYPTRDEALWYNSTGLHIYECVVGRCPKSEFMWPVWEKIWQRYQERSSTTNKEEPETQTDLPVYTADDVVVR